MIKLKLRQFHMMDSLDDGSLMMDIHYVVHAKISHFNLT